VKLLQGDALTQFVTVDAVGSSVKLCAKSKQQGTFEVVQSSVCVELLL